MGLFKIVKAQVQAVTTMAAEIKAAMPAGGAVVGGPPVQVNILNPTPQAEVDRLLEAGGIARGVVMGSRDDLSDGDRSVRTRVHVRVCARMPGGSLGPESAVKAWVSWKVAVLLEPGLEIPVEIDRATGHVTGLATGQLADELAPRAKEAKQRHKGYSFDTGLEGITGAPAVVREAFSSPPPPPPPPSSSSTQSVPPPPPSSGA